MQRLTTILVLCFLLSNLFAQGDYLNQRLDQYNKLPYSSDDIIFLGNSITHFGEWQEYFPGQRVKNRGIASNRADMVLDRMSPILKGKPKAIFVKIGVNDLSDSKYTPESLISNYELIIERIKRESPDTKIFMQSVLPINKANTAESEKAIPTNAALKEICERTGATYIDLWSHFIVGEGNNQLKPTWSNDMVHLMGVGYAKWAELVAEHVGTPSTLSTPEQDYTPIAGVEKFVNQRTSLFELIKSETNEDIFMFGDDAVWAGLWDELLQSKIVKNRGLSAAPKQDKLDIMNQSVEKWLDSTPKQFWIYAGTNDLFYYNKTKDQVITQMAELVQTVRSKSPTTQIFVQSLLPRNNATQSATVVEVNTALKGYCDASNGAATFVDIHSALKNEDNSINSTYTTNGLALNTLGYIIWSNTIAPLMGSGVFPLTPPQPEKVIPAAYYKTTVVSTASNPTWFFIMAQGATKKIIEQAAEGNSINCTTFPLSANTLNQFWRVEDAPQEKYYIVNRATGHYLTPDGNTSTEATPLTLNVATGTLVTMGNATNFVYENGATLSSRTNDSDGSSRFIFVKTPTGGTQTPTWYQFKNERTIGTLILDDNYLCVTTNTASPVFSDTKRLFRLNWNESGAAFNLVPMDFPSLVVPDIPDNSQYNASSTVSDQNPLHLVISPFATGKCTMYKKETRVSLKATRFDFGGSSAGLYFRDLDVANGRYDFLEYETPVFNPAYPLSIEGKYAIQYNGLITGTKISWFAANTLIDNRPVLVGKTQLVHPYTSRYALWQIKEEGDGKFSIRNNRSEALKGGGDFISASGAVLAENTFAETVVDNKTFALFMDTETFDPATSNIAIQNASGEFLYPISAKDNSNEAVTFSRNVSGLGACYFRVYPIAENKTLAETINEATLLYSTEPSEYPEDARNAFHSAILNAEKCLNRLTATAEEIQLTETELKQAIATYKSSNKPVGLNNDLEQLKVWIDNGYVRCNQNEADLHIINASGVEFHPKQRLQKGIYIVQVEGKSIKFILD